MATKEKVTCPICESAEHLRSAGFQMGNALNCSKCAMTFTREGRDQFRKEYLEYLKRTGRKEHHADNSQDS